MPSNSNYFTGCHFISPCDKWAPLGSWDSSVYGGHQDVENPIFLHDRVTSEVKPGNSNINPGDSWKYLRWRLHISTQPVSLLDCPLADQVSLLSVYVLVLPPQSTVNGSTAMMTSSSSRRLEPSFSNLIHSSSFSLVSQ